jgi:hypothetical protein
MPLVRRLLAGLLLLGLVGTGTELVLMSHFEDLWQLIPLVLIAAALVALGWHVARPGRVSVRVFQTVMASLLAAGVLGVGLHYWANLEFQLEVNPEQSRSERFWKAMHATSPPALAPGIMVQLGLLGLIYAYRQSDEAGSAGVGGMS